MAKVAVLIPFFKHQDRLDRCLNCLKAQTFSNFDVFIRDNSDDNIYYTAAINEGFEKYSADAEVKMFLVLNQDAYLAPDALQILVEYLESNPDCAIACPIQCGPTRAEVAWGGGLEAFPSGQHRQGLAVDFTEPSETYWANGAAMLIRASVVREVGYFDRNLRFIGSDADFSFSARARGWRIMVVPDAVVEHFADASGDAASGEIAKIKNEDMIYFAKKWITGDIYKALSVEGPKLSNLSVKFTLDQLKGGLADIEKMLRKS